MISRNHPGRDYKIVDLQLYKRRTLIPQARFSEVIELAKSVGASNDPKQILTAELLWGTAPSIEGADLISAAEHLEAAERRYDEVKSGDSSTLAQIKFESGWRRSCRMMKGVSGFRKRGKLQSRIGAGVCLTPSSK